MLSEIMYSFQVILVVALFLCAAWLILATSLTIAQAVMKKKISLSALFVGLQPKLFMTAALGLFFFSLYIFIVWLLSYFLDDEMRQSLFKAIYSYPVYFAYGGLAIFIAISVSIVLVRSVIKRFYNSR